MRNIPDANMMVLEELADAYIIMTYIMETRNFSREDLFSAIDIKIEREKKRLERIEEMNELYGVGY